jgi:sigma-B regulation protein RsbU (phosphoserine phosphatase)
VGGDYYDLLDLGEDRIGIAAADVSGKGIGAALLMSVVQASLRVLSGDGDVPLAELANKMNRFLYQSTSPSKYATFFYAQIDEHGRRLRYVNAGHNPPYLVRGGSPEIEIVELSAGGAPLGLFPASDYQEAEMPLRAGDLLVAFTDGVTEALNTEDEEFGEERLQALLRQAAHLPVDQISALLAQRMREWMGTAEQHDDLTFVLVSLHEPVSLAATPNL